MSTWRIYAEFVAEVDRILYEVWDPIGINDAPEARDEYSSYVPRVVELTLIGDRIRLHDELHRIVRECMELDVLRSIHQQTVDALLELRGLFPNLITV